MKIDIFRCKDKHYLVPSGSDLSTLPEEVDPKKMKSIDLKEGENRIGLSGTEAIKSIKERGYYIAKTVIKFTVS
jgi:hypothetical protein